MKYGLHMAVSKDNVKRNRLKEPDKTKYELYDILKKEVGRCGNWNVLVANLKRQGVEVSFKHKGQTNEVQGVVFTKNGYRFNGSKVDRRFSYSKIDAALQRNRYNERMGMTAKVHDVATPNTPSGSARNELFSGSLGLLFSNPQEPLNNSLCAVPDGALGVAVSYIPAVIPIRSLHLLCCKAASILE